MKKPMLTTTRANPALATRVVSAPLGATGATGELEVAAAGVVEGVDVDSASDEEAIVLVLSVVEL
jgi:hypothetical protein